MSRHYQTRLATLLSCTLILGGVTACKDRSVGAAQDAGAHPDGATIPDGAVGPDAAGICANPRQHMGLVWATHVASTQPEPSLDVYEVAGTAIYLGPVTVPLATNPAFDREVQVEHTDGLVSIVQYYLPPGLSLPVEQGLPYTFWLRNRQGFEGSATGVVITRPTSGLVSLLFVGDTGSYGRAFSEEDPALSPLKVYVEPRPECPDMPDPDGCGVQRMDQLRFDSSTGGMITDVRVVQGAIDELALFGDPWRVMNLASTHVDQPCPDSPGAQVSYLAINTTALPLTCDPSRFYVWDTPYAIDVGSYCDELFTCTDSPDQTAAIEAVSPDATCGQAVAACGAGNLGCVWDSSTPVDQSLYDQLCAVSVLADAPDRINCNVYFE